MDKFDEINEDNIWDISHEDLQKLALSGKTELMSARTVIWTLNKEKKDALDSWENGWEFNQEKFDEFHTKKQTQENFNNFLSESNLDEDQKKKAQTQFDGWYWLEDIIKLSWATSFEQNQNNSNKMNIWGGESWAKQQFDWKISHTDYKQLDKAWQEAYKSFSRPKFWGLSFDRGSRND